VRDRVQGENTKPGKVNYQERMKETFQGEIREVRAVKRCQIESCVLMFSSPWDEEGLYRPRLELN
jgi:hypothetical protein